EASHPWLRSAWVAPPLAVLAQFYRGRYWRKTTSQLCPPAPRARRLSRPRRAVLTRLAIERMGARLEGPDHAFHRLVEQHLDDALEEARAELEIDIEVDEAALFLRDEGPVVGQVLERAFAVAHIDAVGPAQDDARGEALAHHLVADEEIAEDFVALALADARADAPGQEFGIALDIGDEIEELRLGIGEKFLLGVGRHRL